ncbi:hypothetical protein [Rhizobium esperanzae]|uniref:Uncharacterized protein n=1 Tax=Rhizobium esperanzae TaxID=1967781 RepID=A0A7W6QZW4_9HYPH|nr:hypothetical protein [Rhizobium esperanzae]MBB4234226.1 hypothetical protein [Rhizobium esperanzae]
MSAGAHGAGIRDGRGDEFAHGSPGSPDSLDRAAVKTRDVGRIHQAERIPLSFESIATDGIVFT